MHNTRLPSLITLAISVAKVYRDDGDLVRMQHTVQIAKAWAKQDRERAT